MGNYYPPLLKKIFFHKNLKFLNIISIASIFLLISCASKEIPTKDTQALKSTKISENIATELGKDIEFLYPSGLKAELSDISLRAGQNDYILIGEQHNDPKHHMVQAAIIKTMAMEGNPPIIGLEMVPATMQPILDEFNKKNISVEELPFALDWKKTWGYDYTLYQIIFQVAADFDLPLYGLNISQAALTEVRHKGINQIKSKYKSELPSAILLSPAEQRERLEIFFKAHAKEAISEVKAGLKPDFNRFILTQSLWDTVMAKNAYLAREAEQRPMVIIAGSGHVGHAYGIAHRLPLYDPEGNFLLIMPARSKNLSDYEKKAADFFFVSDSPRPPRLGIIFEAEGLEIKKVIPGSLAEKIGMKKNDIILRFFGQEVKSAKDMHSLGIKNINNENMEITVTREGKELSFKTVR